MENQITKCHVVEYANFFELNDAPYYEANGLLNAEDVGEQKARQNADLAAQGINVTQETGKTPRQLADENKMLLEALILAKDLIVKLAPDDFTEAMLIENAKEGGNFDIIIKAINKATK